MDDFASVLQPLATQRVYVLTPARDDAYLELELLHEARLEDGLEAGRLAPELRERGLELRDGHRVDLGLRPCVGRMICNQWTRVPC